MELINCFDYVILPKNSGLEKYKSILQEFKLNGKETINIRGEDIPQVISGLIKQGKKVIGITGEDLFKEYLIKNRNSNLKIIKRIIWDDSEFIFRKPTLCFLGPKEKNIQDISRNFKVCVNLKYKELAKKRCLSLLENKGFKIKKIYAYGATEDFFINGLVDFVIDIVCSGNSAEKAGLKVYEKLYSSDIVIIGEKNEKQK